MLKEINLDDFLDDFKDFDLLIDARSPEEFIHSKIPGAINLYALNDNEHKEVGTIYKQKNKSEAKLLGAKYICLNAAKHIDTLSKRVKIGSKIAIYCARGGLRSSSLATIFSNIGYRVYKLDKGYKGFRSRVVSYLENFPHKNFVVLGGNTGCGKTELIKELENSIDLEGLANHLGSTFGQVKGEQPSQKEFQNRLFFKLLNLDLNKPVFIEGESKKIGSVILPDLLYRRMGEGKRVEITAPLQDRVKRILKDYESVDDDYFYYCMERITPYIKKEIKERVIDAYESKDLAKVAELLLVGYYDNVYKKPVKIDYTIENRNIKDVISRLDNLAVRL